MLRRLALLFCLTLLAACGQETGGSNDTANDAVATASAIHALSLIHI